MTGGLRTAVAAVSAAVVLAWAGPQGSALPSASAFAPAAALSHHPCGTATAKPAVDEVLLIWEENQDYSSIIGNPAAPELNFLASHCGLATNYEAETHPSLPNYLEMTSGQSYASWPWDGDCDPQGPCTSAAPSVFSELAESGGGWRSYAEGMAGNCGLESYGTYAARHNPATYYTSARSECEKWDVPMGSPTSGALHEALVRGPLVRLTTVTPDVLDDMHSASIAQGDHWLASWVPEVIMSPAYRSGRLAVVIVWDEGEGSGNITSHVPLIVMSASTPPGSRSAEAFNDYSVLQTVCQLTGVASLGRAKGAASLVGAFHL